MLTSHQESIFPRAPDTRRYKSKAKLIIICLNVALSSTVLGYFLIYLGALPFDTVTDIYKITLNKGLAQGFLNGCIPIGAFIGAIFGSALISYLSRRHSLLIVNCLAAAAGVMCYYPNFYCLLACRLLQGVCTGIFSTLANMIVKELAPVQIAGSLGAIPQLMLSVGTLSPYLLAYILKKTIQDATCQSFWKYIFGVPVALVVIQTITLLFVFNFETPKYWLMERNKHEARKVLQIIYKPQFVEQVLRQKIIDVAYYRQSLSASLLQKSLITDETGRSSTSNEKPARLWLPIIVGIHLSFLQQFSGVNSVNIYCGPILSHATSGELVLLIPSLMQLTKLICNTISARLLHNYGRKNMISIGCFVQTLATGAIGLGFLLQNSHSQVSEWLVIVGLVVFMATFGLTLGPVVWLYIPQIVPPKIVSITTACNWLGASCTVTLFPIIKEHVLEGDPGPMFFFFAGWCFLSLLINQKIMIETKGKTQSQIRKEYSHLSLC